MQIIYLNDENKVVIKESAFDYFTVTISHGRNTLSAVLDLDDIFKLRGAVDDHINNLKQKYGGNEGFSMN